MPEFLQTQPKTEDYWRGIILLGRNVATYKLALAKSLLDFASSGKTFATLAELAVPYTKHLADHIQKSPKQITSKGSQFLDTCRAFAEGEQTQSKVIEAAVKDGFANVIDAFHVVNNGPIPERFFVDERKTKKGITLTDTVFTLAASSQGANLPFEVESRWRLLETAWALGLPASLLEVQYDSKLESIFVNAPERRIDVTGCRDALNGYQRGKCFYCRRDILISGGHQIDVDHFFPIKLWESSEFAKLNLNGLWNLVLTCIDCNRGNGGKFARLPTVSYLERLHHRNEFFIDSPLPMRETIANQTGLSEPTRRSFLQRAHSDATRKLIHTWAPPYEFAASF